MLSLLHGHSGYRPGKKSCGFTANYDIAEKVSLLIFRNKHQMSTAKMTSDDGRRLEGYPTLMESTKGTR